MTTAADLRLQLELFAAYLTDPGFREEAFRRAERRLEPIYRELRTTVSGVLSDAVARAVADDDFRFGYPPLASVLQHDAGAVRYFLLPALEQGYLELSVVGDIDPEAVYAAVAGTLAALPQRAAAPDRHEAVRSSVQFRSDRTPLAFQVENDLPQAMAVVFWPTNHLQASIEESRRMNVLANIVRDRLRIRIRDEMGAAYSPSARNSASEVFEGFGFFQVLNGADRGNALAMAELMRETVANVRTNGVSDDDLDRALRPLRSFLNEYRRDNGYWLNRVLFASQAEPRQLDWARTIVSDYEAIQREEIDALARRYLDPEEALIVTIEPTGNSAQE
jgi:zinc protease